MLQDPSLDGRFGEFGGRFVPETLVPACQELEAAFRDAWADPSFRKELDDLLRDYAGRPSILTECHNLGKQLGIRLLLKREDMQSVFSFKLRGAYNKMALLKPADLARGVIAASAGNHAQGVALAAKRPLLAKRSRTWAIPT